MKPYFETHPIGVLYYVVVLGWYLMEFIQLLRQQEWRKSATQVRAPGFAAAWAGVAIVSATMLFVAPHGGVVRIAEDQERPARLARSTTSPITAPTASLSAWTDVAPKENRSELRARASSAPMASST
jgi:hypothetical protein